MKALVRVCTFQGMVLGASVDFRPILRYLLDEWVMQTPVLGFERRQE